MHAAHARPHDGGYRMTVRWCISLSPRTTTQTQASNVRRAHAVLLWSCPRKKGILMNAKVSSKGDSLLFTTTSRSCTPNSWRLVQIMKFMDQVRGQPLSAGKLMVCGMLEWLAVCRKASIFPS